MSFKPVTPPISSVIDPSAMVGKMTHAAGAAHPKLNAEQAAKAHKVGKEFEAIFVRQVLSTAKIGPPNGLGGMATEALADELTSKGGLGLASKIEDAVAQATARAHQTGKR